MLILKRLQELLDRYQVQYQLFSHQEAYTAPELAHVLHVSGKMLAKVVIVKADDRFVMAVLPSNWNIDFMRFQVVLGAGTIRLASEEELKDLFPDCQLGTMPPFGNLYGLEVYVDESLTEDQEIIFQGGTHFGAVKLRYHDFASLVRPRVAEFHQVPMSMAG